MLSVILKNQKSNLLIEDYVIANVLETVDAINFDHSTYDVFDLDDDDKKEAARRITIDGQKYIYCDSLIAIEASDQSKIDELADKGYELNGFRYMAATASPSNEKHAVKYYAQINNNVPDEETIFNKIDKLMGGALSYKLTKELVSGKAITKANTRIGNYASGMQCLANINFARERVAVVKGSIFQAFDFDEETTEFESYYYKDLE